MDKKRLTVVEGENKDNKKSQEKTPRTHIPTKIIGKNRKFVK